MSPGIGKPNREGRQRRRFGATGAGTVEAPNKLGSRAVARIDHARERGGCSLCFPHGAETTNSQYAKNERTWKRSRTSRWAGRRLRRGGRAPSP